MGGGIILGIYCIIPKIIPPPINKCIFRIKYIERRYPKNADKSKSPVCAEKRISFSSQTDSPFGDKPMSKENNVTRMKVTNCWEGNRTTFP